VHRPDEKRGFVTRPRFAWLVWLAAGLALFYRLIAGQLWLWLKEPER